MQVREATKPAHFRRDKSTKWRGMDGGFKRELIRKENRRMRRDLEYVPTPVSATLFHAS